MASSAKLGERLENYVSELVKNGRYQSRSEVLREGVRLVEEREKRLAMLDSALQRGLDDARDGRVTELSELEARLTGKYEKLVDRDTP